MMNSDPLFNLISHHLSYSYSYSYKILQSSSTDSRSRISEKRNSHSSKCRYETIGVSNSRETFHASVISSRHPFSELPSPPLAHNGGGGDGHTSKVFINISRKLDHLLNAGMTIGSERVALSFRSPKL